MKLFDKHNPGRCEAVALAATDYTHDWSERQVALLIGAIAAGAIAPGLFAYTALAQTLFPDVPDDYWAQPFIASLAQEGIVTGYPDGTFRPEENIDRDEYAAIIRQAFNTDTERQLASASTLEDVPEDYWAAPAIEEAYEMGFMGLPEEEGFNPDAELTRVNAIVALMQGLEPTTPVAVTAVPTATPTTSAASPQAASPQRGTPFHLAIPMASTQIMQVFAPPAAPAATPAVPSTVESAETTAAADAAGAIDLSDYYTDADQIPDYAREEVAEATRLGLVVNYPEVTVLNPTAPISRSSAAALIHQTLVYRGQLEPLPENSPGSSYVVREDSN